VQIVPAGETQNADTQLSWPLPPCQFDLAEDEVHVWCASLRRAEADYSAGLALLDAEERARAASFHFEGDRKHFIARRSLLRGILGRYLKIEPSQITLALEERGKPRLAGPVGAQRLHFNSSHSRSVALFAVCRFAPLGVDVEQLRPMPEMSEIAATFCSPPENALLDAAPQEKKLAVFFDLWTRKEAWLKATGEGIAGSLAQMDCSVPPPGWAFLTLSPSPGFAAGLAFPGSGVRTRCWQWPA
jgi:4'-phosphopantetheinyl transferase